jgi:hypothetical protein
MIQVHFTYANYHQQQANSSMMNVRIKELAGAKILQKRVTVKKGTHHLGIWKFSLFVDRELQPTLEMENE